MSQHIKNVVLVHGAFADGSGWKRVADILKFGAVEDFWNEHCGYGDLC